MRWQSKLVEIPSGATQNQIESALDTQTRKGWELIQVVQVGSKIFAILRRLIAK
jgi:hypothetical protein